MKDAILLTKSLMDPKLCLEELKKTIIDASGNENIVSFGKIPKTLYIWFPSLLREEEGVKSIYEDIPNIHDYLIYGTYAEFHRDQELKKVVQSLKEVYPELYVMDDDNSVYSAEEYLEHYKNLK